MKIVICDDEPLFVKELDRQLHYYCALRDLSLETAVFYSASALLASDLSTCDLLFLDIEMPDLSGMDAARRIREQYPELLLVFVTNYLEYAPAGYVVHAFRYLLKNSLSAQLYPCLDDAREKLFERKEAISIFNGDRNVEILLKNIIFIEGTSFRQVRIYLSGCDSPITCAGKMAEFEERLSGKGFLRIQKSYLVNRRYITSLKNYYATLRDGRCLKVSERNYARVKRKFLIEEGKNHE